MGVEVTLGRGAHDDRQNNRSWSDAVNSGNPYKKNARPVAQTLESRVAKIEEFISKIKSENDERALQEAEFEIHVSNLRRAREWE